MCWWCMYVCICNEMLLLCAMRGVEEIPAYHTLVICSRLLQNYESHYFEWKICFYDYTIVVHNTSQFFFSVLMDYDFIIPHAPVSLATHPPSDIYSFSSESSAKLLRMLMIKWKTCCPYILDEWMVVTDLPRMIIRISQKEENFLLLFIFLIKPWFVYFSLAIFLDHILYMYAVVDGFAFHSHSIIDHYRYCSLSYAEWRLISVSILYGTIVWQRHATHHKT